MSLTELIEQSGLSANALAGRSYRCSEPATLVPLHEISRRTVPLEVWKLQRILDAIATDTPLQAIRVRRTRRLVDGHHRLAIAEALGAATVPVVRRP